MAKGIIRVNVSAGSATINFVIGLTENPVLATYISGDNFPQVAGNSGEFEVSNRAKGFTVYGEGLQDGMKWKITDSREQVFERPYVGGNSEDFTGLIIRPNGTWIVEIVPA